MSPSGAPSSPGPALAPAPVVVAPAAAVGLPSKSVPDVVPVAPAAVEGASGEGGDGAQAKAGAKAKRASGTPTGGENGKKKRKRGNWDECTNCDSKHGMRYGFVKDRKVCLVACDKCKQPGMKDMTRVRPPRPGPSARRAPGATRSTWLPTSIARATRGARLRFARRFWPRRRAHERPHAA